MLQFLLGSSSLNINWLIDRVVGLSAYNSPILFFIALIGFAYYRVFDLRLHKDMLVFVGVVGAIGFGSALMDGFTRVHGRQLLVFAVAATCWIFTYELSLRRDIITRKNTEIILWVYLAYLVIVLLERYLTRQSRVAYVISSVFAPYTLDLFGGYVTAGRLPFFSSEPSMAACSIAGIIMPCLAADLRLNRTPRALALFAAACVILFFAEGLTSRALIVYSVAFVLVGEWAIVGVAGLMAAVLVFAFTSRDVIVDRSQFTGFLWGTFGGRSDRVDAGLRSGSYLSRLFNWFLGVRAFLDAPLLGHGIGGTAAYLVRSVGSGTIDTLVTSDQERWYRGMQAPSSAQMLLRIPGELGLVGTLFILSRAQKAVRLIFGARGPDRAAHAAFAYVTGAMLVIFILDGALLNPVIPCFVVLLGQLRRRLKGEAPAVARPEPIPGAAARRFAAAGAFSGIRG